MKAMKHALLALVLTSVIPAACPVAQAGTAAWTGSSDSNWYNGNNWNPVGPPAFTDTLSIYSGLSVYPEADAPVSTDGSDGGGSILLAGPGSNITFHKSLTVGDSGKGLLDVQLGGQVKVTEQTLLGAAAGSLGTANVSGSGSKLNSLGNLTVGQYGQGRLTVTQGAYADSPSISIGRDAGSMGTANVSGSGSKLNSLGDLTVGDYGEGHLTITQGAAVKAANISIGRNTTSLGMADVSGPDSTLNSPGDLTVGDYGEGHLTITQGAAVEVARIYIGRYAGSSGTVILDGGGASLNATASDLLQIGGLGMGTLEVRNGAFLTDAAGGYIGSTATGSTAEGVVTVKGSGSFWNCGGDLLVGNVGAGTLSVLDGAFVASSDGQINGSAVKESSVTVSGAESFWSLNNLDVGVTGEGRLDVSNSGSVYAAGAVQIWNNGRLDVSDGGIVIAGGPIQISEMGELGGDGTVTCTEVLNGGLVNPGNNLGQLKIEGDYRQQAGGTLHIELGGTGPAEFDNLNIIGEAYLGGLLEVDLVSNYKPQLGQKFDILTAASIHGAFTSIDIDLGPDLSWIIYGVQVDPYTESVRLEVVGTSGGGPVPEPLTLVTGFAYIAALVGYVRRRRRRTDSKSDFAATAGGRREVAAGPWGS